jgi:hypothetical protein
MPLDDGRFEDAPEDAGHAATDSLSMEYAAPRQPGQYIDDVDVDDDEVEDEQDSDDDFEHDLTEAMDQLNDMDWEEGAGGMHLEAPLRLWLK